MRTLLFSFLVIGSLLCQAPAYAQSGPYVGTVDKVRESAFRIADGTRQELAAGSVLHAGDTIETSQDGRISMRFLDGSTLQLSGNATIVIDDLVYSRIEGEENLLKQALTMVEGVFLMTSGAIAAKDSTAVQFSTPVATIGIRGTKFLGGRLTAGMSEGTSHYGFQIVEGAISVDAPGGSVVLDEPGEGTFLPFGREAAPTPVRQWTDEEEQEARDLLAF